MVDVAAVILAAGKSTRMKSALPKVLHPIAGRPVVRYVVDAARGAGVRQITVVVGYQSEAVRKELGNEVAFVEQREQLGTGHALLQAKDLLIGRVGTVLVLCGDMPLVSLDTMRRLLAHHAESGAVTTVLTCTVDNPEGLGRIVRDGSGLIERIAEEKEATEAERSIREINTGAYCFASDWLWPQLSRLPMSSVGEFFLTDTVSMARSEGKTVGSVRCADPFEALGINNRLQLSEAEGIVRRKVCERLMLDGVTIVDPASTKIDASVKIGADTVIYPGSSVEGNSEIGRDCKVGPNAIVRNSVLGHGAAVMQSEVESTVIGAGAVVGPFACIQFRENPAGGTI